MIVPPMMMGFESLAQGPTPVNPPGYLKLFETGQLIERAKLLQEMLGACRLCPRRCEVNRSKGELGACGVDWQPKVAAISIHRWEEPPISGTGGSGTIFFSGCTLHCTFCQNYPISQLGVGRKMSVEQLAAGMLRLQRRGAHNLNLVTSAHQMAAVVEALHIACNAGLQLPIVYNSSGYESLELLELLDGVVDIYLPDSKYADPAAAQFCSLRQDYVSHNRSALLAMWRQVGPLQLDGRGIAVRGMLVRHLVLPANLAGTRDCLAFLRQAMGPNVWVSLMGQYFPAHRALHRPPLDRKVTRSEYDAAFQVLLDLNIENGFVQDLECAEISSPKPVRRMASSKI